MKYFESEMPILGKVHWQYMICFPLEKYAYFSYKFIKIAKNLVDHYFLSHETCGRHLIFNFVVFGV